MVLTFILKPTLMNEGDVIFQLKKGDRDTLKKIYLEHKREFFKFANRFHLKDMDLEDIYQDAMIALMENAQKGKMDDLGCSIKTYLFSIGKYMAYNHTRNKSKTYHTKDDYVFDKHEYETMDSILENESLSFYQKKIVDGLKKLGNKCREILTLFYYSGLTIEEIMSAQGYENKNTVKSQKSRCLKSLKELIKKENE